MGALYRRTLRESNPGSYCFFCGGPYVLISKRTTSSETCVKALSKGKHIKS